MGSEPCEEGCFLLPCGLALTAIGIVEGTVPKYGSVCLLAPLVAAFHVLGGGKYSTRTLDLLF